MRSTRYSVRIQNQNRTRSNASNRGIPLDDKPSTVAEEAREISDSTQSSNSSRTSSAEIQIPIVQPSRATSPQEHSQQYARSRSRHWQRHRLDGLPYRRRNVIGALDSAALEFLEHQRTIALLLEDLNDKQGETNRLLRELINIQRQINNL